jgi:hypothetical protein
MLTILKVPIVIKHVARRRKASIDWTASSQHSRVIDMPLSGLSTKRKQVLVTIILSRDVELSASSLTCPGESVHMTARAGSCIVSFENTGLRIRSSSTRRCIVAAFDMMPT